jgi:protein-tyrosine kinase
MSKAIYQLDVLAETKAAVHGKETGDKVESVNELALDLSQHAVPIRGIFTEAASAEELQLVQRLFFLPGGQAPRVAVFCSVRPRDGVEYICARAAEILALQTKDAVCLVDANLKDPKLHERYDLDSAFHEAGLNAQMEKNSADGNGGNGFWVLPASALRESCPGLVPEEVRDRLSTLRKRFGYLLLCAPSLDSAADSLLLGQMSDGVVLILEPRSTQRAAAVKARQLLEAYNIRLLGVVLNQQEEPDSNLRRWKVLNRKRSESA